MRAAQKADPDITSKSSFGGRRPGAGRKPSTLKGILKRLPPEAAELLTREIKAKAELIQLEIKLKTLRKANISRENSGSQG
jgi:hypothetical protein